MQKPEDGIKTIGLLPLFIPFCVWHNQKSYSVMSPAVLNGKELSI